MKLEINQTVTRDVDPVERYYPTDIEVALGEQYRFAAHGTWQDASHVCGPTGWRNRWTPYILRLSRLPQQDLFYLGGNIARDESSNFPIGSGAGGDKNIDRAGELFLFANDLWLFYGNNLRVPTQPLLVDITRVA
ncbi:hypothetical protein ACH50O_05075 [Methylomonas sp. 2BW1-5-20]|uniref:hypothetical protein n=1 Tax=Methylomonas sp. 2BW1-5-20 TaxID=3376686 RepID=UPI0040508F28